MSKRLSTSAFVISHLFILLISVSLLIGLAYFLNKDFPKLNLQNYNPVTKKPASFNLELNNPDDELLTFDPSVIISGKTAPAATVIVINLDTITGFEANQKGEFSKVISLNPGLNQITITSFDQEGNKKQTVRDVYYSEEKI